MHSFRHAHIGFFFLLAILAAPVCSDRISAEELAFTGPNGIAVRTTPNPVNNGRSVLLEINARNLTDPIVGIQAWHGEKPVPVYPHPLKEPGIFVGFIGISYYRKPEVVEVKLEWTNNSGYHFMQIPIEITQGQFQKEKLRVPKSKVQPSTTDRIRIADERSKIRQVYSTPHPARLWKTVFGMPAAGKVTSPFGSQRVLNGRLNSYHSGVDFRAPTGSPIYASNDGIVRFTSNLFYSGNHIIIDHGLGISTNYSHLDAFSVQPGQPVQKGQEIGQAGSTGRSNGPHLHWGAKVNGTSVDPMQLKELIESLFAPAQAAAITESE